MAYVNEYVYNGNNVCRIIEKVAIDILWDYRAASKVIDQKEIFQPECSKDEI